MAFNRSTLDTHDAAIVGADGVTGVASPAVRIPALGARRRRAGGARRV
jgi:hypothetical protein